MIPLAFLYFGFLIFSQLGSVQLEFFDEARRGVNALEMYSGQSPHFLVTSYAGSPEHWGTKPPLLIWCQVAAVSVLGPTVLAIRLPAALATLAAIALMCWFTGRHQKNPLIGLLAGWILLSNWNFVGSHGARSGDFDALLLLFTLAQVLFFYHWTRTEKTKHLLLSALALLLAGWTKGIAACFFLPAMGLWVLLDGTARKQLFNWQMYLAFSLALLGILSFYFLREAVDPGFMQLVWENELGGRYLEVNEQHDHPWYHYLEVLLKDATFLPFALLAIPGAFILHWRQPSAGWPLLFLLALLLQISVISYSATKLFWYMVPALPYIALLSAGLLFLFFKGVQAALPSAPRWKQPTAIALLLLALLGPAAGQLIYKVRNAKDYLGMPQHLSYHEAIQNPEIPTPYTVLPWHYHSNARFYVLQQQLLGRDIQIQGIKAIHPPLSSKKIPEAELQPGQRVLICENDPWVWMAKHYDYQELFKQSACKLVEIRGARLLE